MSALLLANWQAIAGLFAAIAGALGLYLKGRGDAKAKAKLEDITHANEIRRDGASARASADPSRVHDDGFRRD
jgi:hypothetical protein